MRASEISAIVVVAVLAFWMLGAYNRLVRLRQSIAAAFAQIDAQFKQRHALLAELVEGAAVELEGAREAAAALDAARCQARVAADHVAQRPAHAGRVASLVLAEQVLQTALSRVVALLDARADPQRVARLTAVLNELTTMQHRLAAAGEAFNAAVLDYNRGVAQFPTRLVAGMFGFRVGGTL